jgi:hypothetical protein
MVSTSTPNPKAGGPTIPYRLSAMLFPYLRILHAIVTSHRINMTIKQKSDLAIGKVALCYSRFFFSTSEDMCTEKGIENKFFN